MTLAWGAKITAAQRALVVALCARIGIEPSWLMAIMWFESRLNPAARNALSGATGLIQFMPNGSIRELGTTPEALAAMTFEQQLVYVERYFVERDYAGRMKTLADAYMAVFWPAAIGKPDSTPLITDATSKAYVQNRGLDVDRDGQITKAEAAGYVVKALADGMSAGNVTEEGSTRPPAATQSTPNQGEGKMGALATAGLIGQLLQTVVSVFQPAARAKVEQAAAKVTDEAGVNALADGLMNVLKQVTGITDPVQATAAVTAPTQQAQAKLAQVEQAAMLKLDEVSGFLETIGRLQAQADQRREDSRNSARAFNVPEAWKLRWAQASFTQRTLGWAILVIAALVALMTIVLIWVPPAVAPAITNLLGQLVVLEVALITGLVSTFRDQTGFSFGGTSNDNSVDAARDELEYRRQSAGSKS